MRFFNIFFSITIFLILNTTVSKANIEVNSLFSNHMVLQQGVEVPIWGIATQEELVTVEFNGQIVKTQSINGKWRLKLAPLKAGGPFQMIIIGSNKLIIEDVLVGEVWLCSGQSNMERQLKPRSRQKDITNWQFEKELANYPQIRQYMVPLKFSDSPIEDAKSQWKVCNPENVLDFSAVGYFFARDLYKNINTPIGILFSAYGGTDAEHWTSREDLEENAEFVKVIENYDSAIKKYKQELNVYEEQKKKFLIAANEISTNTEIKKDSESAKLIAPVIPFRGRMPGGLYNGMIYPLLSFPIKGVCWYQGENNNERHKEYANLLTLMISGWRRDFNQGLFPFLIVQIAPYKTILPELREAQWDVTKRVSKTALIVTTDCGDSTDIHPSYKQPVGKRLANAATGLCYDQKVEISGPEFKDMNIEGNKITVNFNHIGKGLEVKGDKLIGFSIAGSNKQFEPAIAVVRGKKVIVRSDKIPNPMFVRYAWSNSPINVNLYNIDGLPAIPFRSDKAN